jgi:ion channel-forming bestrophin family protein
LAVVVVLHELGYVNFGIPNVMLTVLGVVIGFVISYRAVSGYDRYWMGRTCWSDVVRNSRTMGRLIWFHVPPLLSPRTQKEKESGGLLERERTELRKVMAEKRLALDLLEGYAIALKHHLRGETGIYFEDLYELVRPLHEVGNFCCHCNWLKS